MANNKKTAKRTKKQPDSKVRIIKIVSLTLLVFILLSLVYFFLYEPRYKGPFKRASPPAKPLVFAHRGFGVLGPDNSLAASVKAIDTGLDGVDVDGQLTKDGKIVIFHDLSLDRLTEGKGKISDYTLEELEQLDLAKKYKPTDQKYKYGSAPVESFEEFVKKITPRGILMVELKVSAKGDTGIEREAYRIIEKYNAFDRVYLSAFNPLVIKRLESIDSRINTVYIFMDTNWNKELLAEMNPSDVVELPWFLQKEYIRRGLRKYIKPDMLSVNQDVSEATRKSLIEQGWPIMLWATNTDQEIKSALDQQPYGLITDEPVAAKQARDNLE